jgi:hypothetical protein
VDLFQRVEFDLLRWMEDRKALAELASCSERERDADRRRIRSDSPAIAAEAAAPRVAAAVRAHPLVGMLSARVTVWPGQQH